MKALARLLRLENTPPKPFRRSSRARPCLLSLRRLLLGGLLASVASALLPWSNALAEDAKTLRIGYQKFNSINILKGSGALEKRWRRKA